MRLKCIKTYSSYIKSGEYYHSDNIIHLNKYNLSNIRLKNKYLAYEYIFVCNTKFVVSGNLEPKLKDYFINIGENRKLKLKKLNEIFM